MQAIFDMLYSIFMFGQAITSYLIGQVTMLFELAVTAFSLIEALPTYMLFVPAVCVPIITSAIALQFVRDLFF